MSKKQNYILKLVKSMNTQEKVYFKKQFIQNKKDLSYIDLFKILDNVQEEVDENHINKKIKSSSLRNKNVKRAKEHLNEAILSSLSEYHKDNLCNLRIYKLSSEFEILIKKGLFQQAFKQFKKIKELCVLYDKPELLAHSFNTLSQILVGTLFTEDLKEDDLKKLFNEYKVLKNQISGKIKNHFEIINSKLIYGLMVTKNPKNYSRVNSDIYNIFIKRINHNYLSLENLNHYSQFLFLSSIENKVLIKKSINFHENWLEILEKNKNHILIPVDYVTCLQRLTLLWFLSKSNKNYDEIINKAYQLYYNISSKQKTNDLNNRIITITTNYQHIKIALKEPEKAISINNKLLKILVIKEKEFKDVYIGLFTNLSYAFFILGDYKNSLGYCKKVILNYHRGREDAKAICWRYFLMNHIEKENYEQLKHLVKSAINFYVKNKLYGEFEKLLFSFISKINSKESLYNNLNLFLEGFRNIKSTNVLSIDDQFNYLAWVKSKIENKKMIDLL